MRTLGWAALGVAVMMTTAHADEPPPPPAGWRLMISDLTLFRLNPLGLETRARIGFQKRLYASEKQVAQNNFGFVGLYPKLNPVSAHLGVGGDIQPLSILNVKAFAEVQQYFGTLGFMQSFTSAGANYSDHQLDLDEARAQTANVVRVGVHPLLQVKLGPIAIRSLIMFDYFELDVRDGDVVAYEPTYDTLLPDGGWILSTDTDVLFTGVDRLAVGLRHSWVHPFYQAKHGDDDDRNAHQRLGLFGAYTLRDDGPSSFNKPTIIAIASWYLQHRWRTGSTDEAMTTSDDFTSRAMPYLLVGFAFESDLL